MEEIPRMPMLWFEIKLSPVCPDFAGPIKQAIVRYYGEDGNSYDREIQKLEQLRNEMCRAPSSYDGCALLKRYYAQIYGLVNRFSKDIWKIGVQCVWADIYTGKTVIGDLDLELASVLYNIGVLHIVLGGTHYRKTSDEIKMSCTHFQCAAWAFQHLMDNPKLARTTDLPDDLLRFCVQISLAQAQVCILEKSMLDKRKPGVVARVACQVVEYYRGALGILDQSAMNTDTINIVDTVGSKLYRSWKKIVELKIHYYWAIYHYYLGDYAEEQQKMGDRVGWYESAEYRIKEAAKLVKERDCKATESAVKMVTDMVTVKLTNAKKENDFIYHEKVTPADSLEELRGGPLVKGIPFSVTDQEILVEDIFARLVPIEAHEIASIFSLEIDKIRRKYAEEVEDHNNEVVMYLSSIQLERDNLRTPKEDAIPDELIEICAYLSAANIDIVAELERDLHKLDQIGEDAEKLIHESKLLLDEEQKKELAYQETFGKRPQSLIQIELSKELAKHEDTNIKGIESNRSLWENFDRYKEDIRIMSSSSAAKIAAILPSNKDITFDEEVVKKLEYLFDKIEEMKKQRQMLYESLVKQLEQTNLLKYAVAHTKDEVDEYFQKEKKKFQEVIDLLEQNFAAQKNILAAMTKCNATYGDTRKSILEVQKNRKTRIASMIYSHSVFKELHTNSEKGLEFFERFKETVTRINARIRGVCKVQDEERAQMMNPKIPQQQQQQQVIIPNGQSEQISTTTSMNNNNNNFGMPPMAQPFPSSTPSSLPPSPAVMPGPGAKLKDYLAYMKAKNQSNQSINTSQVPSTSSITQQQQQQPQHPMAVQPQNVQPQQPTSMHQPPLSPYQQQQQPQYPAYQQPPPMMNQPASPYKPPFQQGLPPASQHYSMAQQPGPVYQQPTVVPVSQVTAQNFNYVSGTSNTYSSLSQPIPAVVPIQPQQQVQPSQQYSNQNYSNYPLQQPQQPTGFIPVSGQQPHSTPQSSNQSTVYAPPQLQPQSHPQQQQQQQPAVQPVHQPISYPPQPQQVGTNGYPQQPQQHQPQTSLQSVPHQVPLQNNGYNQQQQQQQQLGQPQAPTVQQPVNNYSAAPSTNYSQMNAQYGQYAAPNYAQQAPMTQPQPMQYPQYPAASVHQQQQPQQPPQQHNQSTSNNNSRTNRNSAGQCSHPLKLSRSNSPTFSPQCQFLLRTMLLRPVRPTMAHPKPTEQLQSLVLVEHLQTFSHSLIH